MPQLSMDIGSCNSIFELFAAFNFAYAILSTPNGYFHHEARTRSSKYQKTKPSILKPEITYIIDSKSFVDMVDYHLVKPFSLLNENIQKIKADIYNLKISTRSRKQLADVNYDAKGQKKCDDILKSIESHEKILSTCQDMAETSKATAKERLDNKFPYVSFLLALFCISVLAVSASNAEHKHLTLLFVDVALFFTYLCMKVVRSIGMIVTYWDISIFYLLLLTFCVFLHFYVGFKTNSPNPPMPDWLNNLKAWEGTSYNRRIIIVINMCIPFFHFIYYLVRFKLRTWIIVRQSYTRLDVVKSMIKKSQRELDELELNLNS